MWLEPFAMERMQSTYENLVDYNLSESGVHPFRLEQLLDTHEVRAAVLGEELGYTQSNGTPELRAAIAALYSGAGIDHVEVTNGGSEANFIACLTLLEPGDEVVLLVPTYMQARGLSRAFAGLVREWRLEDSAVGGVRRWRPNVEELAALVNARTRAIVVCNPNNPTGARLSDEELDAICAIADRHGAWVLADEIYRGAELDGRETPSLWGRYERTIVTSGLSKAYGLPGLRIGWIVAPPGFVARCWASHDYTTIAPGALSDRLARVALSPIRRARIIDRTRAIIRDNLPVVTAWLDRHAPTFDYVAPEAGAILYARYALPINSTLLADRAREEQSVLVVPGDHFGMDGYLRLGFGLPADDVRRGLDRLSALIAEVLDDAAAPPAG